MVYLGNQLGLYSAMRDVGELMSANDLIHHSGV